MNLTTSNTLPPHPHPIERWHHLIREGDTDGLNALLAPDAVFHSPVFGEPQRGRLLAAGFLTAAYQLLSGCHFSYVREIVGTSDAMLEFEADLNGIEVNGIDIIRWNEKGEITDVKVMLRPLDAIHAIQALMTSTAPKRTGA